MICIYLALISMGCKAQACPDVVLSSSNNGLFQLKHIETKYDTLHFDFGKAEQQTMLSPTTYVLGMYKTTNDSLMYHCQPISSDHRQYRISDNGQNIIAINTTCRKGNISKSQKVVLFLHLGETLKSYSLSKFINTKHQTVQFNKDALWCLEDFEIENDNLFHLTAVNLKTFSFNLSNGKLINSQYRKGVNRNSVIIYGDIDKDYPNENTYAVHIDYVIQGRNLNQYYYKFQSQTELDGIRSLLVFNEPIFDPKLNDLKFKRIQ